MSHDRQDRSLEERFDYSARVDEFRSHSTKALRSIVADARREQQRWYLEELAATRVLEDRQALDAVPDTSVSARTAKTNREVARSLESLPEVAAAAWDGMLSKDQLAPVTEVATPETDAEWAQRGARTAPVDLQRHARAACRVTAADAAARRQARYLTTWRDAEQGMVFGRWALPDVDGVLVEKVLDHMAERMRPAKGMAWDSLAHRKADALVELCQADGPRGKRSKPLLVVHTSADRPGGEVEGMPIAEETVQAIGHDPQRRGRTRRRPAGGPRSGPQAVAGRPRARAAPPRPSLPLPGLRARPRAPGTSPGAGHLGRAHAPQAGRVPLPSSPPPHGASRHPTVGRRPRSPRRPAGHPCRRPGPAGPAP